MRARARALPGRRALGAAAIVGLGLAFGLAPPAHGQLLRRPEPSRVIFPEQTIPLRFTHAVHVGRAKMECTFCHDKIAESTRASDRNIPGEDSCDTCHNIDREAPAKQTTPPAACVACHPGFTGTSPGAPPRVVVPEPNLRFPHKLHLDRRIACAECHGDLSKVELATRAQLPRMATCLKCHNGRTAPARCTTCHLSNPDGTVQTTYPAGRLVPTGALRGAEAHDLKFRTDHAKVARNDERLCLSCHRRDECLSCHDGSVKPFDFHGNDYLTLHPIDARKGTTECSGCHRRQTFCVGCHQRSGVGVETNELAANSFQAGFPGAGAVKFHPLGWVDYDPATLLVQATRGPNHHSFQAQRNLRTCASCHRESFCVTCHASNGVAGPGGGSGFNPHPRNFLDRCRAMQGKNLRVCLRCHNPADATDAELLECRRP